MGPIFLEIQFYLVSYRPGSKNTKPDILSHLHAPEIENSEPAPIIQDICVLGAFNWSIESKVMKANESLPAPPGTPPNRLFVPPPLRGEVIGWAHENKLSCHSGIRRTLFRMLSSFGGQKPAKMCQIILLHVLYVHSRKSLMPRQLASYSPCLCNSAPGQKSRWTS